MDFLDQINTAKNIEDIIRMHSHYLTKIRERSLLYDKVFASISFHSRHYAGEYCYGGHQEDSQFGTEISLAFRFYDATRRRNNKSTFGAANSKRIREIEYRIHSVQQIPDNNHEEDLATEEITTL